MKKTVIIINGQGGCGKDTLIGIASKHYNVSMISSITPVKQVAFKAGWEGEKDNKARKFLSDLKSIMTEYNDAAFTYCRDMYRGFLKTDEEILFVQIREPNEISRFVEFLLHNNVCNVRTLLIRNAWRRTEEYAGGSHDVRSNVIYGNKSDDEVENYDYDYIFENKYQLSELEDKFIEFFKTIVEEQNE